MFLFLIQQLGYCGLAYMLRKVGCYLHDAKKPTSKTETLTDT